MSEVRRLLRRHHAFWERDRAPVLLRGTSRWPYVTMDDFDWGLPEPECTLAPEMLNIGHFAMQYRRYFERHGAFDGDMVWAAAPLRAFPWLESILGCEVRVSVGESSIFAEPVAEGWTRPDLDKIDRNPWYLKLAEFVEGIADVAAGRFPVAIPLLRGPWDLVCALRGMSQAYLDLYDRPDSSADLARYCADLWLAVVERLSRLIPRWEGGWVNIHGLWAPEFPATSQDDASISVSPEMYRRVMLPADQRTLGRRMEVFHLHSGGLHVLPHIAESLAGRALNVSLDPSGPHVAQILPILKEVHAGGIPMHLYTFDPMTTDLVVAELAQGKLAVLYQPTDA